MCQKDETKKQLIFFFTAEQSTKSALLVSDKKVNSYVFKAFLTISAPTFCPYNYPYILNGGKSCCRHFNRKIDASAHPLCDGQTLGYDDPAECCDFDEIVDCRTNYCQTHPLAESM